MQNTRFPPLNFREIVGLDVSFIQILQIVEL